MLFPLSTPDPKFFKGWKCFTGWKFFNGWTCLTGWKFFNGWTFFSMAGSSSMAGRVMHVVLCDAMCCYVMRCDAIR